MTLTTLAWLAFLAIPVAVVAVAAVHVLTDPAWRHIRDSRDDTDNSGWLRELNGDES